MRRLSIEVPESLHQQIKAQASIEGLSMRAYVLQRLGLSSDRQPETPPVIADYAPGAMRELIHSREWRGTRTPAEIDAQIAEERASWSGADSTD